MPLTLKSLSFIVSLLGICILLSIIHLSSPVSISSPSQLIDIKDNQKVIVSGFVIKQASTADKTYLQLDNNLTLSCSCQNINYKNKNISALGVVSTFNNKISINVLKIYNSE